MLERVFLTLLCENSKALTLGDCKQRGIYRKGEFVKHGFKGGNGA